MTFQKLQVLFDVLLRLCLKLGLD